MNESLQRYSASLLLLCVFSGISPVYAQTTDYTALSGDARAECWAGHYDKAETLLRTVLELAQRVRDEYALAAAYGDLGAVYQNQERLMEAGQSYEKALSIFSRIPNTNYERAVLLHNLGSVDSVKGRHSRALRILNQALKLLKKNTPDEQALTAQILNGTGMVYFQQGKVSKAEGLLTQAMAVRPAVRSRPDLVDSQILSNLGSVYQRQSKYAEAEESYKRSLRIAEQLLGPVHPYLTITLFNLGDLYTEMRLYSDAKDEYRRSLSILEQMTPTPDGRIVGTLQALSNIYLQQGEKTNAESMLERAITIARRDPLPGSEMPAILDAYADILTSSGRIEEAQRVHAEARRTRAAMALTVRVPKPK